jgi:putative transposase
MEDRGVPVGQLEDKIGELLADAARSGTPAKFSAYQVVQIIAVACEEPQESDRSVSHWTPRELADEVVRRGIVEKISPQSVERFLKGGRCETASEPLLAERESRRPRTISTGGADGV